MIKSQNNLLRLFVVAGFLLSVAALHPGRVCAAEEQELFSNINIYRVENGPTAPTTFKINQLSLVTYILTYHYNGGAGVTPGTLALRHEDGTMYGPWQATGGPEEKNPTNMYWVCRPHFVLKPGVYTVIDSHPASWAWNTGSGGGMTVIKGRPVAEAVSQTIKTSKATQAPAPKNRPGQELAEKALQASLHGKYDEAISYADKVIQLKPDNMEDYAKGYFARGLALYNQGKKKEAISDLNWATNFWPTFLDAYVIRGNAKVDLGMYDEAISDQDKALKLKPDYARAYCDRGFAYYKKGMYDEAIADSTRSLELNPNDPVTLDTLGHVYFKKGDYDQAIQNYGKALQLNSKSGRRYMYRATAYLQKKMYDEALADCQKGIELEPKLAEIYNIQGKAYASKKEYEPALQNFDAAIKLDPENTSYHFDHGMVLKEMGREDEGLGEVQQAVDMSPDVERFQKGLAEFGQ